MHHVDNQNQVKLQTLSGFINMAQLLRITEKQEISIGRRTDSSIRIASEEKGTNVFHCVLIYGLVREVLTRSH